ncbi:MAG: sigma-54 dependent transcriptional regulator [Thermodesulfobacteriota bacterium]
MHILVVDDEQIQREMLAGFLKNQGYNVITAAGGAEALNSFEDYPLDLVLLDHRMGDMNGDEVLAKMKARNPLIHAIMITAYGAVETAVKVMQLGADDFLEKPVDLEKLLAKIRTIDEQLIVAREADQVAEGVQAEDLPIKIIGDSAKMQNIFSMVKRAAPTPWTILVRGETGTGKELIGRLIHGLSPRNNKPFMELNCAAVPENLFESELFGHEKGAFTGADKKRKGLFEQAHGGTLFLDEVGEIPAPVQAKLLRVLQEKTITRLGSSSQVDVDVRIVAATNRDLKNMVDEGLFREDLFFRLNVIEMQIPPLRERKEDISALLDFFLAKYSEVPVTLASEAMTQVMKYNFPGNVRELEHLVQRLITMTRGTTINLSDLPPEIRSSQSTDLQGSLGEQLAAFEERLLTEALKANGWVQTRAAEQLGISERVLRYKMQKAGIKKG